MDSDKLDALLQRYWNCETTLEEEQLLRDYFSRQPVQDKYQEAAALFQYLEKQRSQQLKPVFDSNLKVRLRQPQGATGRIRFLVFNAMRIAAGVAVLLAAVYLVRQEIRHENPVAMEDTYTDPEQAFEETKKALMMISKGFGNAEQQVKKISVFNRAQEKVQGQPTELTKEISDNNGEQ